MADLPHHDQRPAPHPRRHAARRVGETLSDSAVLLVGGHPGRNPSDQSGDRSVDPVSAMLTDLVAHIEHVPDAAAACAQLDSGWFDAVMVIASDCDAEALRACETICARSGAPSVVLYSPQGTLELATKAMRLGVRDLLGPEIARAEFCERLLAAIEAGESNRDAADREARLKRLCSKLDRARREVTGHVGGLCNDLADAYEELADQIGELATAGELRGILRQELDIEGLLRTFLEYLLGRVGSTNAGVFLPNSVGDFTLGAYINYDRPRATAESELEDRASVIAPAFESEGRVVFLNDDIAIADRLGDEAGFFAGESVIAVGCHDTPGDEDSECLAVLCLFRDRRTPFSAEAQRTVQVASELFGRQLARVIRVHHRHKPDELWGVDDDIDLAA